ncbi:erythromycin resistance leader peptide [Bacillus suaedaesalsae]|uniref:Erythromycin resistance leader peptide n=1 Tax=Bacillus suaedaesalsae TaxID=2810349 RepID=A0ABS2DEQ9_9BACI|nr:erythromycin resistance leader peptide [Bacillus suaedaesalsae]
MTHSMRLRFRSLNQ